MADELTRGGMLEAPAPVIEAEVLGALADLMEAWTNNGPYAHVYHDVRVRRVRQTFSGLAAALDRLARLTA